MGIFILKNVLAALGAEAQLATHFLNAYGQQTESKWKQFLVALNAYVGKANDEQKNTIIAGALYGFNQTLKLFKKPV